jgi:hypothetical protein
VLGVGVGLGLGRSPAESKLPKASTAVTTSGPNGRPTTRHPRKQAARRACGAPGARVSVALQPRSAPRASRTCSTKGPVRP